MRTDEGTAIVTAVLSRDTATDARRAILRRFTCSRMRSVLREHFHEVQARQERYVLSVAACLEIEQNKNYILGMYRHLR